jgi:sugar/nucleoside kinase (ribokinase family)
LQVAIVTACADEDDGLLDMEREAGIWVHRVASPHTTTFRNVYNEEGQRTQFILGQAKRVTYADVPDEWCSAPIVHLGPVAQELPEQMPGRFIDCLLGVTPQGWMRSWDGEGRVSHSAWPIPEPLTQLPVNAFLVLSIEDLGNDSALVEHYKALAPLVAITHGREDAMLCHDGHCAPVPANHARIVDPTGAGDVFATALLVRYRETGDLVESARFAHAAAACVIEGPGTAAIPDRAMVEERLRSDDKR